MNVEDKARLKEILNQYSDKLFERYYITNPPILKKNDRLSMGYGTNKSKDSESINFVFKTTKPSEEEIRSFVNVFVDMLKWLVWFTTKRKMLTKMKKIFQNETVEKIFYFISIGLLVFFLGRIVLDVVDDQPFSWRNVIWSVFFFTQFFTYRKRYLNKKSETEE